MPPLTTALVANTLFDSFPSQSDYSGGFHAHYTQTYLNTQPFLRINKEDYMTLEHNLERKQWTYMSKGISTPKDK